MRNIISANLSTNVVNEKLHEVNDVFQLVSQTTTKKLSMLTVEKS